MYETHPVAKRNRSGESVAQSYAVLFRRLRFNAFVLQSGFNTGAFMVMASAAASLMTELLHRPATEFGLYFLLFPDRVLHRQFHLDPHRQPRSRPRRWCWPGRCWRWPRVSGQAAVLSWRPGDAAGVLSSRHVHHHGPGHRDALRPGRRHGGGAALCRHRGRHRRVHAEFRRGGVLAALRRVRRRHAAADDHDRGAVRHR